MKYWKNTLAGFMAAALLVTGGISRTVLAAETESAAETEYPLTITTYTYAEQPVEYTFEKEPERVIAAYQDNIEILLALGLEDKIVCAFGMDGEIREDLKDSFDKINYLESRPSKEDVLALEPDFITGWSSLFAEDRLGEVDFWHERGTGTYMSLNSGCRWPPEEYPQTIQEECEDILTMGKIFNVQDRAEELVDEIQTELDRVAEYIEGKEAPSIAILENESDSYRVYGENRLAGDVAKHAGAQLAVGKAGEESGNISAEDLISLNPDAIFMVWYEGFKTPEEAVADITENPAFASLDAVKNEKVFAVNLSGIYCSGMRTLDGVEAFAGCLYPELYK